MNFDNDELLLLYYYNDGLSQAERAKVATAAHRLSSAGRGERISGRSCWAPRQQPPLWQLLGSAPC